MIASRIGVWMGRVGLIIACGMVWPTHADTAFAGGPSMREVFEQHAIPMMLIEPESGRIVEANPAAARFYGLARSELHSMTIQQINMLTPEQVAAERALAATEGRNYFIFRHRTAGDEIRTVEVHSRPYPFDGETLLLSIITDITPGRHEAHDLWHYQQRLEEMVDTQVREIERVRRLQSWGMTLALLAQAVVIVLLLRSIRRRKVLEREREALVVELGDRNRELQRLGEAMAHHFQEPARRLVSYAQRLRSGGAPVLDAQGVQAIQFIDEQARRLSSLVGDVQRYLAIDHFKIDPSCEVDSEAVLQQAIAGHEGESAGQEVLVVHSPLPEVVVPAKLLLRLFSVLLDNALRYRRADRPLRVEVDAVLSNGFATFRFADNGSGIAPDYREQVFGLFNRLVPSTTPGSGMGLAVARKIVVFAGGQIHIEDGLDGGVCVVFDLPVKGKS